MVNIVKAVILMYKYNMIYTTQTTQRSIYTNIGFSSVLVIWSAIFIAVSIFQYELSVDFWFLPYLFWLVLLLCGFILLIISLVISFRKKSFRSLSIYTLPILIVCAIGLLTSMFSYDIFLSFRMSSYEEIVQKVTSGELSKSSVFNGIGFEKENTRNDILRVAFPNGTGVIDNWCGLVWDPSGLIGTVNKDSVGLFGGDLIGVRHKGGYWYVACFT